MSSETATAPRDGMHPAWDAANPLRFFFFGEYFAKVLNMQKEVLQATLEAHDWNFVNDYHYSNVEVRDKAWEVFKETCAADAAKKRVDPNLKSANLERMDEFEHAAAESAKGLPSFYLAETHPEHHVRVPVGIGLTQTDLVHFPCATVVHSEHKVLVVSDNVVDWTAATGGVISAAAIVQAFAHGWVCARGATCAVYAVVVGVRVRV